MENKDDKKQWEKPEMEVLTRGKAEEAVLANCKSNIVAGPGTVNGACLLNIIDDCFRRVAS